MRAPRARAVRCDGKTHPPCPDCGKRGRRKRRLHPRIRTLACRQEAYLDVHDAEYRSRCPCRKSFRSWPLDVPPKADYDEAVRQAVLDRGLADGLNVRRAREAMRRDFLPGLSEGFVYDCLDGALARLDLPGRRQRALANFSGTLRIDELHLGRHALLSATDPLSDEVAGFALVLVNDQAHMRRFLLMPKMRPISKAGEELPSRRSFFSGEVLDDIQAAPPVLVVGQQVIGHRVEETFSLSSLTGRPFRVLSAHAKGEDVATCSLEEAGGMAAPTHSVRVGVGVKTTGAFRGEACVEIEEQGGRKRTICVPVQGHGTPAAFEKP